MKILIPLISLCLLSSVSWSNCIGDCVNGQGTYTWPDGEKYVGKWKDGGRNGQGTLTLADGRKYVGQFNYGYYDGQGTLTWPNGQKYVGQFKDDKRNGQGTLTLADGRKYVGQFKGDNYDGQGTLTWPSGSKKTGIWQEGVYFGTIVEWERAEKERITAEKMRQRAKQEADDKYDRIYNACLLDKGASVDMQVSSLERALRNVCKGIAKDPSWLENMKYD